MTNKFQLSSIALLVALSGCASQQVWSPELEEARKSYQAAASDPVVSSLAAAELDQAQKQLQAAEDAADFFKGREVIAHEATLAHLKSQEAQQTARALSAKENLRLAQTGSLPATMATPSPVLAAATPQYAPNNGNTLSGSTMGGSMQGGSIQIGGQVGNTEAQQIAQQLAALSNQINQLQARISAGALQSSGAMQHNASSYQTQVQPTQVQPAQIQAAPASEVAIRETEIRMQPQPYTKPVLAAALPPRDLRDLNRAPEPEILDDARLHEELRAMNARPSSRGMSLTLGERYFESGSARLWNGRAGRHLDNIAAVMVENPGLMLEVEAHTDSAGSQELRNNLTADRATAIKSSLVLRGVNASRINTAGFGDSAPIADNNTELGKLQNRRVEIIFPNVAAR